MGDLFGDLFNIVGDTIGSTYNGMLGMIDPGRASREASKVQTDNLNRALDLQRQIYNENVNRAKPFYDTGTIANNRYMEYLGLGGNASSPYYGRYSKPFSMNNFQKDPGYTFRLGEGLQAINKQFAGRGGIGSGRALKAINDYAQNSASQEYQNAYNRYYNDKNQTLAPLSELINRGYNAGQGLSNAGNSYANSASSLYSDRGDAGASGIMGSQKGWNDQISQAIKLFAGGM